MSVNWLMLGFLIPYTMLVLKETLIWAYVWQLKEYRFDKIRDYLSLPEFKAFFCNPFAASRALLVLLSILFVIVLSTFKQIGIVDSFFEKLAQMTMSLLLFAFWLLEVAYFFYKVLHKKILRPKFTPKASVITFLAGMTTLVLGGVFVWAQAVSVWHVLYLNLLVFYVPVFVGFWIYFFSPLTWAYFNYMARKARAHRQKLSELEVVGISGAYGKTTTKELTYQLLNLEKKVEKTTKNANTVPAVAQKTLSLTSDTEVFLSEIGAYKVGHGSSKCRFIQPTMSIITGLNEQHLALFGSQEKILTAESESLNFLPEGAPVFINWTSLMNRQVDLDRGKDFQVIRYGLLGYSEEEAEEYDIYGKEYELVSEQNQIWGRFTLVSKMAGQEFEERVETNLVSHGNVENLVGSIAVSLWQGVSWEKIKTKLTKLENISGNLNLERKDWGVKIDDSYNNNLDSVRNIIRLLDSFKDHYRVLVLDDILELGPKSVATHQLVGKLVKESSIEEVYLMGRNFEHVVQKEARPKEAIVGQTKLKLQEVQERAGQKPVVMAWEGRGSQRMQLED
jgi:UDP-N-acetylmuramoyl-tripeptide--D-alanyl-D-alanine ligase